MVDYNSPKPINIGNEKISIKDLVEKIKLITGFNEGIWDKSKKMQPRRCLDGSILENELNFKCDTNFESGLRKLMSFKKKY